MFDFFRLPLEVRNGTYANLKEARRYVWHAPPNCIHNMIGEVDELVLQARFVSRQFKDEAEAEAARSKRLTMNTRYHEDYLKLAKLTPILNTITILEVAMPALCVCIPDETWRRVLRSLLDAPDIDKVPLSRSKCLVKCAMHTLHASRTLLEP